jgi:hypothetical protein
MSPPLQSPSAESCAKRQTTGHQLLLLAGKLVLTAWSISMTVHSRLTGDDLPKAHNHEVQGNEGVVFMDFQGDFVNE